jgi:hypothetical protein
VIDSQSADRPRTGGRGRRPPSYSLFFSDTRSLRVRYPRQGNRSRPALDKTAARLRTGASFGASRVPHKPTTACSRERRTDHPCNSADRMPSASSPITFRPPTPPAALVCPPQAITHPRAGSSRQGAPLGGGCRLGWGTCFDQLAGVVVETPSLSSRLSEEDAAGVAAARRDGDVGGAEISSVQALGCLSVSRTAGVSAAESCTRRGRPTTTASGHVARV